MHRLLDLTQTYSRGILLVDRPDTNDMDYLRVIYLFTSETGYCLASCQIADTDRRRVKSLTRASCQITGIGFVSNH